MISSMGILFVIFRIKNVKFSYVELRVTDPDVKVL